MNAIVPRQTIEQIVTYRNLAIEAYQNAFAAIDEAGNKIREAYGLWKVAAGSHAGASAHGSEYEIEAFNKAVNVPNKEQYFRTVVRLVDRSCWYHLVELTRISQVMDKEAKDELENSLRWIPEKTDFEGKQLVNLEEIKGIPPVTVENVNATIEKWMSEADMMFKRGIAKAFSSLDRRFRSHDGFKIGDRIVLTYAFNSDSGNFDTWSNAGKTLADIERTFRILDGQRPDSGAGIAWQLEQERGNWKGPQQSLHEGEFFRLRAFKNGNAHLWFTRDDLVEKVNRMLAAHYGEAIGDGMTKEADPLKDKKTTPARNFGFFPTPPEAADFAFAKATKVATVRHQKIKILEPSAGTGNLARKLLKPWNGYDSEKRERFDVPVKVDCIEMQAHLAKQLEAEGLYARVYCEDFLQVTPKLTGLYDLILMNPPFDRDRDVDHVSHALDFLKPGGQLVAIMSAGTEFRDTLKARAFRAMMEQMNANWFDMPAGSFASVGTYVNTVVVVVWKDGRKQSRW